MKVTISFNIDGMPIMSLASNFMLTVDGVPYIQFDGGDVGSSIDPAFTTEESMRHIDVPIETVIDENTGEEYTTYGDGDLLPGNYVVKHDWSNNVCTISVDEHRDYSLTFDYNGSSVTMPLLTHRIPVTGIVEGSAGKNIIGSFYGSSEVEDDSGGDEPVEEPQDEPKVYEIKIDEGAIEIINDSASWIYDNNTHILNLYCNDVKVETNIKWIVNQEEQNTATCSIGNAGNYAIACYIFENDVWNIVGSVAITIYKKVLQIVNVQTQYIDKNYR